MKRLAAVALDIAHAVAKPGNVFDLPPHGKTSRFRRFASLGPTPDQRIGVHTLIVSMLVCILGGWAGIAPAMAQCEPQPNPGKWCNGGTIGYSFGLGLDSPFPPGQGLTIKLAILQAIDAINFEFEFLKTPLHLSPGGSKIVFTYGKRNLGAWSCGGGGKYASTSYLPSSSSPSLTEADIDFNNQFSGWNGSLALTVALHEIGHALGVGHVHEVLPGACGSGSTAPLMYYLLGCGDTRDLDDHFDRAIACLYGPNGERLFGIRVSYKSGKRVKLEFGYCSGNPACGGPLASARTTSLRYDLSISDNGGPYVPFASLTDNDWVDNAFDYEFVEAHANARVKMEVWDGSTLISSPESDPIDVPEGLCSAAPCMPSDQCHVEGTCDPITGLCSDPTRPDGIACDDGNACTAGDMCGAGVCNPGSLAGAPEVGGMLLQGENGTTLSWTDLGGGAVYDIASSTIPSLRGTGTTTATCLSNDVAGASYVDGQPNPTAGAGYYYLVRAQNACGPGTYGFDSMGAERLPTAACP